MTEQQERQFIENLRQLTRRQLIILWVFITLEAKAHRAGLDKLIPTELLGVVLDATNPDEPYLWLILSGVVTVLLTIARLSL